MSLLFSESPLIAGGAAVALLAGVYLKSNLVIGFSILMIVFLLYFYRYSPYTGGAVDDNVIISPCEGTVLDIVDRYDYYYIPIFLSPFNRHTQIYPANCLVLQRKHDLTGQFSIVMNLDKSKNNEKKIHYLMMNNGSVIELTQIAGFLPRVITSGEDLGYHTAGEYLGMIKFGSRIDLLIPRCSPDGTEFVLTLEKNQKIKIGDFIGDYR